MTDVQVEQEVLDADTPMMFRDLGTRIRMAYDPRQCSEREAMAALRVQIPRLAQDTELHRLYV